MRGAVGSPTINRQLPFLPFKVTKFRFDVHGIHNLIVDLVFKKRKQRRNHGFLFKRFPVKTSKKWMSFYSAPSASSKSSPRLKF